MTWRVNDEARVAAVALLRAARLVPRGNAAFANPGYCLAEVRGNHPLMRIPRESLAAIFLLALSACGGAPPEPTTPATPPAPAATSAAPASSDALPPTSAMPSASPSSNAATAPAAPEPPAHDVWSAEMTKDQQVAFMKKNVIPEMDPVFKAYDAKMFANFGCKTCHGPKFKLPKDFLPQLTFKDGKLVAPADAEAMKMAKFMGEQVVPHMATAMGLKPFDMETHQGFGCHGCHEVKMK